MDFKEIITKSPDILKLIYEDGALPGVQQATKAIEGLMGLGSTILFPINLIKERKESALKYNMEKFRAEIENLDLEKVIPVAPEIGVPILEKLAYVRDEELSNMYIQLLAKASSSEGAGLAHPSFVQKLHNMSPDEASFIKILSENGVFQGSCRV